MVYLGGEKEATMEMGTTNGGGSIGGGGGERSFKAPLHNFNLPSFLKWGHQRQLRCKLPDKDVTSEEGRRGGGDQGRSTSEGDGKREVPTLAAPKEGIEAVREEIMFDLKNAAEEMKAKMFRDGVSDEEEVSDEEDKVAPAPAPTKGKVTAATVEEEVRRWNLRTRRGRNGNGSAAPASIVDTGVSEVADGYSSLSLMRGVNDGRGEENKREKFSLTLTKKEIEEDFIAMVGHRPPRRPKKRPRTVQRHLDTLFPGVWLSEVTVDTYKVPDVPDTGKR